MKNNVFWVTFLVLVVTLFSGGFFLYSGNVVKNVDKLNIPNLVLDTLYVTNDEFFVILCNNGRGVINNKIDLTIEVKGEQTKPTYLSNSKKTWNKTYNLVNFGRKCLKENIKIKDVIKDSSYKDSIVKSSVYGRNQEEIKYSDNNYEIGYYTFENGIKIRRVNKIK